MKILIKCLLIAFLCVLTLISCSRVPNTHYYQLSYSSSDNAAAQSKMDKILGVKKFTANHPYDQDRIIYRDSPYEVKFYNYHRWICSPREMLTESAIVHLRESGLFAGVFHDNKNPNIDYILSGNVLQFEEWDEGNTWQARIKLWLELQSVANRKVVWQGYIESQVPVEKRNPISVVKALSDAAGDCFKKLADQLKAL